MTGWFFQYEAQWLFSLIYLKTAIWLPNLYRNEDYWKHFELKCTILNVCMTLIYVVFALWWGLVVFNRPIFFYVFFAIPSVIPICIVAYSLVSISSTVTRLGYEKRDRLQLRSIRIWIHLAMVVLMYAEMMFLVFSDKERAFSLIMACLLYLLFTSLFFMLLMMLPNGMNEKTAYCKDLKEKVPLIVLMQSR